MANSALFSAGSSLLEFGGVVQPPVVAPTVITVSGQSVTTIPFNGTLPVFTSSTNDGSPITVGGDTPVNNVAGTYVVTFDAAEASQVTRIVVVQAEVVVVYPVGEPNVLLNDSSLHELWGSTDNIIMIDPTIFNSNADINQIIEAEYTIYSSSFSVKLQLTLNHGIVISDGKYIVDIGRNLINFSGKYYHQFTIIDENNNQQPPLFQSKLLIKKVVE